MAAQGQTMLAASGDSGSEDCFPDSAARNTGLAVDDPGSQPNVVSVGATTLTSPSAGAQVVWNNCQGQPAASCADRLYGTNSGRRRQRRRLLRRLAAQPGPAGGGGAG